MFGMNATQAFLATSFMNQIPKELDEAARIDGCVFAHIFVSIIFPIAKPLIATVGLISFRNAWSDYLLPYVFTISKPARMPLVVGVINLKSSGEAASSWDLAMAGISIIHYTYVGYLSYTQPFLYFRPDRRGHQGMMRPGRNMC
ncbi:hypothetical protein FACS1894110_26650 [Spirochaetia bacterium]|nr:hypothetical protein FACS1894110_26650 [Spirochaetia bacterium]